MTRYLHGIHASSWRDGITPPQTEHPGWLTFTEIAGSEGGDYSRWADAGHGTIVRLNNGYFPNGTIPKSEDYGAFATKCAAFVDHSQGCHVWIIANEPNLSGERPGGIPIQPEHYAACFLMCYAAIKQAHPDHLVLAAPIAPYNAQTGDCLVYLGRVAQRLAAAGVVDGWAIHAYTRAHDARLIYREEIINGWQWHFRTYRDQLSVLGKYALDVPIFLTEYNPTDGWANEDRGYIGEALCEIDAWNQANPRQIIRACCAFRWHDPSRKEWTIRDKSGVVADYCRAADVGYTCDSWDNGEEEKPVSEFRNGSYEEPYPAIAGHDNIRIADGWSVWWSAVKWPDQDQNPDRPIAAPEGKPVYASQFPYRVIDGATAQCLFVYSKLMNAGVYQRVQVGAGKRVTFSQPFQAWCSNSDDPHKSDAELYVRVGIDVRGGSDWGAESIMWGNWARGTAEYASTSISAISETDEITVFVHAWNKWAMKHDDLYLDGATLAVEGEDDTVPPTPPVEGVLRVEVSGSLHIINDSPSILGRLRALFR